jgi:hypothetical protein
LGLGSSWVALEETEKDFDEEEVVEEVEEEVVEEEVLEVEVLEVEVEVEEASQEGHQDAPFCGCQCIANVNRFLVSSLFLRQFYICSTLPLDVNLGEKL